MFILLYSVLHLISYDILLLLVLVRSGLTGMMWTAIEKNQNSYHRCKQKINHLHLAHVLEKNNDSGVEHDATFCGLKFAFHLVMKWWKYQNVLFSGFFRGSNFIHCSWNELSVIRLLLCCYSIEEILVQFTPKFQFVTSCGFLPVSIIRAVSLMRATTVNLQHFN